MIKRFIIPLKIQLVSLMFSFVQSMESRANKGRTDGECREGQDSEPRWATRSGISDKTTVILHSLRSMEIEMSSNDNQNRELKE